MKTILVDAVYAFILEAEGKFKVFKEMYSLLQEFPNRKILLTGARDEDIQKYGLNAVPYEFFTLKQEPKKSDPQYYQLMLKHFHLKPDDVIYFEHNTEAVNSARSIGIKTFFYNPQKKDLKALKEFLDQNL